MELVPVQGASDVERGAVDVVLGRLRPGETGLEVVVLREEPRGLLLAAGHPLAARAALRMGELGREAFVTQPAANNPGWRAAWLAEQHAHGLPGRVAAEVLDAQQLLALVANDVGVCLVPAAAATLLVHPGVVYRPVQDAEPAVLSLAWRPGDAGRAVLRDFLTAVQEACAAPAAGA